MFRPVAAISPSATKAPDGFEQEQPSNEGQYSDERASIDYPSPSEGNYRPEITHSLGGSPEAEVSISPVKVVTETVEQDQVSDVEHSDQAPIQAEISIPLATNKSGHQKSGHQRSNELLETFIQKSGFDSQFASPLIDLGQNVIDLGQNVIDPGQIVPCESLSKLNVDDNKTLEETIHEEVLQATGVDADLGTIAAVLAVAPTGRPPKFYADLVMKEMGQHPKQFNVESPSAFLPSFLADSTLATASEKENDDEQEAKPKKSQLRHSSPIKVLQPKVASETTALMKKRLFADYAEETPEETTPKFPLECNKTALHWLDVATSEEQFLVLRNTRTDSHLSVKLIIRGLHKEAFAFKENWSKSRPSLDIR